MACFYARLRLAQQSFSLAAERKTAAPKSLSFDSQPVGSANIIYIAAAAAPAFLAPELHLFSAVYWRRYVSFFVASSRVWRNFARTSLAKLASFVLALPCSIVRHARKRSSSLLLLLILKLSPSNPIKSQLLVSFAWLQTLHSGSGSDC